MMIKKSLTFLWLGVKQSNIQRFGGVFEVQTTFLTVGTHQPHQSCRKVFLGVFNHPTKFQAKILTGNFIVKKM